jgi:hypothetical protein
MTYVITVPICGLFKDSTDYVASKFTASHQAASLSLTVMRHNTHTRTHTHTQKLCPKIYASLIGIPDTESGSNEFWKEWIFTAIRHSEMLTYQDSSQWNQRQRCDGINML